MKILKILTAGMVTYAVVAGCASTTIQSGSNSNWLEECAVSGDCASSLECFCGVCSKACTGATDCSTAPSGTSCVAASSTGSCSSSGSACVAACSTNADCSSFGAGATCASGVCKKATKTTEPHGDAGTTGTQSHFLDVCLAPSDCATGYTCDCGVCTKACTATSDCAALAPGATCATSIPVTSLCELASQLGSACVIECTTDSDCGTLGSTAVCSAGWCRRPQIVTVSDGSVVTCDDRAAALRARLDPIVGSALLSADKSCNVDQDCTTVSLSNACYGSGCDGAYVSQRGAATVSAELATLQSQECDTVFKAGCVGGGIFNCPASPNPVCVNGECTSSFGTGTSLPDSGTLTCDQRNTNIQNALSPIIASLGLDCAVDDDCSQSTLVSCATNCGVLVSKSGLAAAAPALASVTTSQCDPFTAAGCTPVALPCAFPGVPKCVDKKCKAVLPGPDAGTP